MKATDLEPDLLGHTFCLVGQHNRVTVAAAFLPRVFPQLKLLQREMEITPDANSTGSDEGGEPLLTVASLLSISGPAFSTAVFWIKQQANSQLS